MSTPTAPQFKIIGGDGREYGPVDLATLQQWAREGRVRQDTQVWDSRADDWRGAGQVPELAGMFAGIAATTPAAEPPPSGEALAEEVRQRGDAVAIGEWFGRGWTFFKNQMGFALGTFWLAYVILVAGSMLGIIPCLGPVIQLAVSFVVQPVLLGGVLLAFITRQRGQPCGVEQIFAGFKLFFGQGILVNLVRALIVLVACLPGIVVALAIVFLRLLKGSGSNLKGALAGADPGLLIGLLLVVLVLIVLPSLYFTISYMFALPLVADRRLDFWSALETSRKVVGRHWFAMFGFALLVGLLVLAGVLACCAGMIFTLPWACSVYVAAYDHLFGPRPAPATPAPSNP